MALNKIDIMIKEEEGINKIKEKIKEETKYIFMSERGEV